MLGIEAALGKLNRSTHSLGLFASRKEYTVSECVVGVVNLYQLQQSRLGYISRWFVYVASGFGLLQMCYTVYACIRICGSWPN